MENYKGTEEERECVLAGAGVLDIAILRGVNQ